MSTFKIEVRAEVDPEDDVDMELIAVLLEQIKELSPFRSLRASVSDPHEL